MRREEGKNMLAPRGGDRNEGKVAFGRPAGDHGANDGSVSETPRRGGARDGVSTHRGGGRLWWVVVLALTLGFAGYWMGSAQDERTRLAKQRAHAAAQEERTRAAEEKARQAELELQRVRQQATEEVRRVAEQAKKAEQRALAAQQEQERMRRLAEERARLATEANRKLEAVRQAEGKRKRDEAARAVPTGPTWTNSIGMEFMRIPAGSFQMGKCAGGPKHCNGTSHAVRISKPFYLGKYVVTQAQWKAVMGTDPSWFKGADRPVESVRWDEIQRFIEKLNEQEGHGLYRLPTEAEWEYAARAGSETGYGFGDSVSQLSAYAWYRHNSGGETHPVGQKKPNAWGLYDMYGNVSECVLDWYDDSDNSHTVRGCDWCTDDAKLCQASFRHGINVVDSPFIGFRLVLTAQK